MGDINNKASKVRERFEHIFPGGVRTIRGLPGLQKLSGLICHGQSNTHTRTHTMP